MFIIKNKNFNGKIMWGTLLFALVLWGGNWFIVTQLNLGINETFFGSHVPPTIVSQSLSWVISLAGGVSTFFIGWIVVKFSHKYACWIALILLGTSVFTAWIPWFGLYIISRLLLGTAGSMILVLCQGLTVKFFSQKSRPLISYLIFACFYVSAAIAFALFVEPNVAHFLNMYWRQTQTILGLISLIPLLIYILIGQNFDINVLHKASNPSLKNEKLLESNFKNIIKDKFVWILIAIRATTTALITGGLTFIPLVLIGYLNPIWNGNFTIESIFAIVFALGCVFSFIAPIWNKSKAKIKPIIILLTILNCLLLVLIIIGSKYDLLAFVLILAFLFGYSLTFVTGLINYIPHDSEHSNAKRVTNIFVLFASTANLLFVIIDIIFSLIFDVSPLWATILIAITIFIPFVFSFFLKETRPNGILIPKLFKSK